MSQNTEANTALFVPDVPLSSSSSGGGSGAAKRKASADNAPVEESLVEQGNLPPAKRITRACATVLSFVKTEDLSQGNLQCPVCRTIICVSEKGCNVVTCRNHQPQYIYFCAHCKQVCKDAEYGTCLCPKRNTRATRAQVLKQKNERNREHPIELVDDSSSDEDDEGDEKPLAVDGQHDDTATPASERTAETAMPKVSSESANISSVRTEAMTTEWLARLEQFLVNHRGDKVTLVIATKNEMEKAMANGKVFERFVDQGLIIFSNKEKPYRINSHGEVYAEREPGQHGYHGLHPGTEGDTMWLQGIEDGQRDLTPEPKFTDPPRIKGDLFVSPCGMNDWEAYYFYIPESSGRRLCIQDIKELGSLPGPYDGPKLAPIIDKIKAIVKNK